MIGLGTGVASTPSGWYARKKKQEPSQEEKSAVAVRDQTPLAVQKLPPLNQAFAKKGSKSQLGINTLDSAPKSRRSTDIESNFKIAEKGLGKKQKSPTFNK